MHTNRLGKANIKEALSLEVALATCLAGAFLGVHSD